MQEICLLGFTLCLHNDTDLFYFQSTFQLELHPYIYDIMNDMKKVWIYKRKNIKGWWVGWYESGNRKAKALPNKKLAEHFCQLKYSQLNSDVFTGIVIADWQQMCDEYREAKKVQGVTEGTLYVIQNNSLKVRLTSLYFREGLK